MEFWLVTGTWALAFVSIWGLRESRNAIAISERAWVAPIDARLDEPLQRDKPIKVVVLLENSGKQPALNVQNVANGGITLPFSAEERRANNLSVQEFQPAAECTGFPKPAVPYSFIPEPQSIRVRFNICKHRSLDLFVADQSSSVR